MRRPSSSHWTRERGLRRVSVRSVLASTAVAVASLGVASAFPATEPQVPPGELVTAASSRVPSGGRASIPVTLTVGVSAPSLDVMVLMDVSG